MEIIHSLFSLGKGNWNLLSSGHQKRRLPVREKVACFELSQRVTIIDIIPACLFLQKFDNEGLKMEEGKKQKLFSSRCISLQREEHMRPRKARMPVLRPWEACVTAQLQGCHLCHSREGQRPLELCSVRLSGSKYLSECFYCFKCF